MPWSSPTTLGRSAASRRRRASATSRRKSSLSDNRWAPPNRRLKRRPSGPWQNSNCARTYSRAPAIIPARPRIGAVQVNRGALGCCAMRHVASLVLLSQVLAITGLAQGRQSPMQPVKPASCPDGLLPLGSTQPPRSTEIRVHYDSLRDSSIATYGRYEASMILRPRDGVNMVSGIMHFPRRPPADLPHLELDLLVHSPVPRVADERSLTLYLDDSIHLSLGVAGAHTPPPRPLRPVAPR